MQIVIGKENIEMILKNAHIFCGDKGFVYGSVEIEEGIIHNLAFDEPGKETADIQLEKETIDLQGAYLLPGLVDIHTHGNSGFDFSDGDYEGLRKMGQYLLRCGITSFLPTSMTLPFEKLDQAYRTALRYIQEAPEDGARVAGIHMEGPFFCEKKKGAQNAAYLKDPDPDFFRKLNENCGGQIRLADVAPELPGATAFARQISKICTVAEGHTDAAYEDAKAVFEAGASHVTHLFNAMPPIHHRKPGVIGAAAERDDITAELICDGLHVHPAVMRMAFKLFPGRICLISDSLRCCGMPDGTYELGGQTVYMKNQEARLEDGTLAGSSINLHEGLRRAVSFGIPACDAIMAATIIPARAIGLDHQIGSIERGKYADLLVCDADLRLRQVYLAGKNTGVSRNEFTRL